MQSFVHGYRECNIPVRVKDSGAGVTLDIYTTVTKKLKQREFDNFEKKLKQRKRKVVVDDN